MQCERASGPRQAATAVRHRGRGHPLPRPRALATARAGCGSPIPVRWAAPARASSRNAPDHGAVHSARRPCQSRPMQCERASGPRQAATAARHQGRDRPLPRLRTLGAARAGCGSPTPVRWAAPARASSRNAPDHGAVHSARRPCQSRPMQCVSDSGPRQAATAVRHQGRGRPLPRPRTLAAARAAESHFNPTLIPLCPTLSHFPSHFAARIPPNPAEFGRIPHPTHLLPVSRDNSTSGSGTPLYRHGRTRPDLFRVSGHPRPPTAPGRRKCPDFLGIRASLSGSSAGGWANAWMAESGPAMTVGGGPRRARAKPAIA